MFASKTHKELCDHIGSHLMVNYRQIGLIKVKKVKKLCQVVTSFIISYKILKILISFQILEDLQEHKKKLKQLLRASKIFNELETLFCSCCIEMYVFATPVHYNIIILLYVIQSFG